MKTKRMTSVILLILMLMGTLTSLHNITQAMPPVSAGAPATCTATVSGTTPTGTIPASFKVTFHESGLGPFPNPDWEVSVTTPGWIYYEGTGMATISDSLFLENIPNGVYSFIMVPWGSLEPLPWVFYVNPPIGYSGLPSLGSFTVNGADVTVDVTFSLGSQSDTSVVCSPNPVSAGAPVTCTATVSGANPTGAVAWTTSSSTGNFSQSDCTLSAGSCSTTYTDTTPGSVTITASYSGDSTNSPSSGSTTLTVSARPLSAFVSASPTSGTAPLTVQFTGSASGGQSPYSYLWSFGDGGSSDQQNPSYIYQTSGTYTAYLKVTDSAGTTSSSDNIPVTVNSAPTYTVTFIESGLPSGESWTVTLDGEKPKSTSDNTITFDKPNGKYTFSVTPSGFSPADSGLINVNGATTLVMVWHAAYFAIIHEVGLPQGTSWSVTSGVVTQTSTSDSIIFRVPNIGVGDPFYPSCSGYMAIPDTVNINEPISIGSGGCSTNVIFVPNSNYFNGRVLEASWNPVTNSYNKQNPTTVWSEGNCYGLSSTALLYFMHYTKLDNTYPCFPIQSNPASLTSDLDLSSADQTTLNNAAFAIMLHQVYDPSPLLKAPGTNKGQQFADLKSSLQNGIPMVMSMWVGKEGVWGNPNTHSVVAWGADLLENGSWAIAVYDPNYPESTQVAIYDATTDTFSYAATGPYDDFVVIGPDAIKNSLPTWVSSALAGQGSATSFHSLSDPEYYIVISDSLDTKVECNNNPSEDKFQASGTSQDFVCGIPGSCGIGEGNVQVYAIPQGVPFSIIDPGSNESTVFIERTDNESGNLVGYGYLLKVTTTQGPLDFIVTTLSSGLSVSVGTSPLNASATFFYSSQQGNCAFQTSNIPVGTTQTLSFTVVNWQLLNSTSPPPVTWTTTERALIPGDLNGDGKVSLADLVILAKAYGSKPGDTNWNSNADIDGNGVVGLSDLVILAQHYGQHYP